MIHKLEALIFDVDGTLADTENNGHRIAFNRAFEDAGLDWHWDIPLYQDLLKVTGGKERMKFYMDEYKPPFEAPKDEKDFIAGLHIAKTEHYKKLLAQGAIPLRPGVERLIKQAKDQGYRLAISTTTTPANITALLTSTLGEEVIDWFEVIAAGDMVPNKKPASDIYFYALAALNLHAESCIAFEDSRNGWLSAQGAKIPTIITVCGNTESNDFIGAEIVLSDMGETDHPFEVIAGNAGDHQFLDLALVQTLHQQALASSKQITKTNSMENKEYSRLLTQLFERVEEKLDEFEEDVDYDPSPDKLVISFEKNSKKIVLNTQRALHEIWLAGNARGWHFQYQEDKKIWYAAAEQEEFYQCFAQLLADHLECPVRFD